MDGRKGRKEWKEGQREREGREGGKGSKTENWLIARKTAKLFMRPEYLAIGIVSVLS